MKSKVMLASNRALVFDAMPFGLANIDSDRRRGVDSGEDIFSLLLANIHLFEALL
jgi:hypothetical protein